MFQNIVLAVDGSDSNLSAVDLAARMSAATGAKLTLVHATRPLPAETEWALLQSGEVRNLLTDLRTRIERHGGLVAAERIPVAEPQGPAVLIAEVAAEIRADLIITGSRGRGAWTGAALGSVSQRLLHVSGCPVLVVPGE